MGRRLSGWATPLLAGAAIWFLSFPLLTAHPTRAASPALASGLTASADGQYRRPHAARLILIVGEEAPPPTAAPARAPVSPPQPRTIGANWIYIPRLGLSQPVGWYTDCLGRAAVPRSGTWRWNCAGANNTYIMAHNPGIFTPILGLRAGDLIEYGDPSGHVHAYHVTSTTIVSNTQLWPLNATSVSSLTLQTCWAWDGSRDFIVRAVEG